MLAVGQQLNHLKEKKMYKFGKASQTRLDTCDTRIQDILNEAIKHLDFSVICGHRNESDQNFAYARGNSKLKFPQSKHNSFPSRAVDIAPFPIKWNGTNARERFHYLAGMITMIAESKNIKIRWGGDWDSDGDIMDNSFDDLPHFELVD